MWCCLPKQHNLEIMDKQILKDGLGWGFMLWLIGYFLGIVLFMLVPASLIGWIIMPIGIAVSLWVLFKKIQDRTFQHYLWLAIIWTLLAVIFDYFFLIQLFKPQDGYYKLDVYLYYLFTFLLPLMVGWRKKALNDQVK